ncbi:hypothetical protein [Streptomyces griseocarneus]|uniref:hypothetical protein n=1 Tax=Streptomyces griseocarneus TaxID=51201 RepID=UPI00167E29A7|nr:hypothetical protein [Streptomyces griseocarneus]MBZ6476463.1 hypothetical protein [Streptomyces griseocarneus]
MSAEAKEAGVARFLEKYPQAGRTDGTEHPALRGCNEIPWSELPGCTPEMPALLHALLDPVTAPEADSVLTTVLMSHMFLLSPATPAALPFLLRLAADPQVPARGDLLGFLAIAAELSRPLEPGQKGTLWGTDGDHPDHEQCRAAFAEHAHLVHALLNDETLPAGILTADDRAALQLAAGQH